MSAMVSDRRDMFARDGGIELRSLRLVFNLIFTENSTFEAICDA
jgi:hypothetical protein